MPWFQCIYAGCQHRFRSLEPAGDPTRDSMIIDGESLCPECGSRAREIPDTRRRQDEELRRLLEPVGRPDPGLEPVRGGGEETGGALMTAIYTCGRCTQRVSKQDSVCQNCGARLGGIRCVHCGFVGSSVAFPSDRCPQCGGVVPGRDEPSASGCLVFLLGFIGLGVGVCLAAGRLLAG